MARAVCVCVVDASIEEDVYTVDVIGRGSARMRQRIAVSTQNYKWMGKLWKTKNHFCMPGPDILTIYPKSCRVELPSLQELDSCMKDLYSQSRENKDFILDVPFTTEEVCAALKMLRRGKSPGSDSLLAEHLLEGGEAMVNWLAKILHAIIALKALLKCGIIIPVYKGSGRDPLLPGSY